MKLELREAELCWRPRWSQQLLLTSLFRLLFSVLRNRASTKAVRSHCLLQPGGKRLGNMAGKA